MSDLQISICSYSFHRLLGNGQQDIFQYINDCKALGCTHLAPWCAHFARGVTLDDITGVGHNPGDPEAPAWLDPPTDQDYLDRIKEAAITADMQWELIAVDRAAMYQDTPEKCQQARDRVKHWIDIAEHLGAIGVRVDSGGPQELTDDMLVIIKAGYSELITYGKARGVEVFIENHWGSCNVPENINRFLDEIDDLHYLYDTNNWAKGRQQDGWKLCAHRADATHVKTFSFDENGLDPSVDIPAALQPVLDAGFKGIWGVESVPRDGNEKEAARKTIALIKRCVAGEIIAAKR